VPAAHSGRQPLVELDRARLLERLDDRVRVGPDRQRASRDAEPPRPADPVGEVAFGCRAQAAVRAGVAEQRELALQERPAGVPLGRRGLGRTWPNPAVGAVLVRDLSHTSHTSHTYDVTTYFKPYFFCQVCVVVVI